MNRRQATQYLMAAGYSAATAAADPTSAVIVSDGASAERVAEPIAKAPLFAVIVDDRYAVARRFAEALTGGGTACLTTLGEAVTVWRNQCRPRLPAHAWRLAGITTYCDFMVLRTCARSLGGRLVHVGEHEFQESGTIVHAVSAGQSAETLTNALRHDDWAYHTAQALAHARLDGIYGDELAVRIAVSNPATDRPGTLVSWVIARTGGPRCSRVAAE
jgi:hypothetical protein